MIVNYHCFELTKILLITLCFFILSANVNAEEKAEYCQDNIWRVHQSKHVVINIDPDRIIRNQLPNALFGFNLRWTNFENDLWDHSASRVWPQVVEALTYFPGATYRYPGGTVSNSFHWEDTIGPINKRKPLSRNYRNGTYNVLFGIEEYFGFVKQVNGHPWYVLNLIGDGSKWGPSGVVEYPSKLMAQSNRKLATYIKNKYDLPDVERYYQLGNELDRNIYQWKDEKYIARSLETIKAINTVDPDAKFVAFLRQFNWKYRGENRTGISRYENFIKDVLQGLPMVNDFSLHTYYDGKLKTGSKYKDIPTSLAAIERAINIAKNIRGDKPIHTWITEHAKIIPMEKSRDIEQQRNTSNILGTISAADYLIGLSQIPDVMGANWQALNGVGRQVFDASMSYNDLRPRPIYWGLRVLRKLKLPIVLYTNRSSPNSNKYEGGYDVNAVGFTNPSRNEVGLWVINRNNNSTLMKVTFDTFSNKKVTVYHYYIAGDGHDYRSAEDIKLEVQLQDKLVNSHFSSKGEIELLVPPLSVSTYIISKKSNMK